MNQQDKLNYLRRNHAEKYEEARYFAQKKLDCQTFTFCFCGKLATGLHTNNCKKYQTKLNAEIVDRLKYLLPDK